MRRLGVFVALALVVAGALGGASSGASPVSIFATGLLNPRGLTFGPDGNLYVAEGGAGGTLTTDPTPGTGKVVRVDPDGTQTTIASGLAVPGGMTMGSDGALYVTNISFGAPPIGLGQVLRIQLPS